MLSPVAGRAKTDLAFLLFFIDGLGLNSDRETNPVLQDSYPRLQEVLSGKGKGSLMVTNPGLGCPGLPQSATGQTALLTGVNPIPFVGGHRSGFPGPTLISIIRENSLLKKVQEKGLKGTFANAYTKEFTWENVRRASVTTYTVLAADQKFRTLDYLRQEKAVYQEFTNQQLRERGYQVPAWTPAKAAEVLLGIAREHQLTVFEYFQTDIAGHRNDGDFTRKILGSLEEFLDSLISFRPDNLTLIITSDHGNIEDNSTNLHTNNPVPTYAVGRKKCLFGGVKQITDIAPEILKALD